MSKSLYKIFLFLLFLPFLSNGQQSNITAITTEDGLSQGMIFSILKDHDGFMWFGTKNGLNRYDGYEFKVYTHDPFDSLSIGGDIVLSVKEDSKRRFWVFTQSNGLSYFDREKETFHPVKINNIDSKELQSKSKIKSFAGIAEDVYGNIWIEYQETLTKLVITDFDRQIKRGFDSKIFSNMFVVGTDPSGALLACPSNNDKKIYRWEEKIQDFKPISSVLQSNILGRSFRRESGSTNFWQFRENTFYKISETETKTFRLKNPTDLSFDAQRHPLQYINYNTILQKHIVHFANSPQFYTVDFSVNPGLAELVPLFSFEDKMYSTRKYKENETTYWIGTSGYGLRKVTIKPKLFRHLMPNKSISEIYGLENDDLVAFARAKPYLLKSQSENPRLVADIALKCRKNPTVSFAQNPHPHLIKFFKKLALEEHFINQDDFIRERLIQEDDLGNIWFTSGKYDFVQFNDKLDSLLVYECNQFEASIEKGYNQCLYLDGQNQLWKGTTNGLIKLVLDENKQPIDCQYFQNNPTDKTSLRHNSVACCLDDPIDPSTYLWVATKGGGLNKMNKNTGEFEYFTTTDGLPDNVVYGILADEANTLWLSTNQGLSNFDPVKKTFKNYTKADGLQDNEFNTRSYYKNERTGEMFFGGINGITAFFPKDFQVNTKKPNIVITKLKIHNETVAVGKRLKERGVNPLKKAISYTKKIDLDWHQNQLVLEFATLDMDAPEKIIYQYRLSNVDNDWVQAGKNRFASYANLAPGSYTFEVKGTNSSGVWNEMPATLQITIHPPWWNTWWFYSAIASLLFFIVLQIYRAQVNRAKLKNQLLFEQKEAERLIELNRIKTNFFSNITHEFRTPLTLILEPLRQVLKEDHKGEIANKLNLAKNNSERLLHLVNQLLDVSKLEAKKMGLSLIKGEMLTVIEPIFQSFLPIAERRGIELEFIIAPNIPAFYFDKNHIEKVVFNLLSNAIKYSNDGKVILTIDEQANLLNNHDRSKPNHLLIKVKDEGIGISSAALPHIFDRFYQVEGGEKQQQGTGIGLALTKELVELMGGTISVKSKEGKGTIFTVLLPMETIGNEQLVMSNEQLTMSNEQLAMSNEQLKMNNEQLPIAHSSLHIANLPLVLLIEDNDELRHFIKQSIAKNYQIIEAENGAIGIEKAKETIPDLIISDLMMPAKNGFEVVKALKNEVKTSHIPIILLTAKTAMENRLEGLREGADDYLTKPFNTEELLIRMANLIEIRKRLQVRFSTPNALKEVLKKSVKRQIEETTEKENEEKKISPIDAKFLNQLTELIQENLGDEKFSVEILAEGVSMSRSQLFRKLKAITNQTPNEFIRNYRLDQAMEMLQNSDKKINQVAAVVGFKDEKYFSKRFKMRFEQLPSEIRG